jgi:START domain
MLKNIFVFLGCCLTLLSSGQQSDCDLKRDTDGIKVYTCETQNEKFRALRAEFVIDNTSVQKLKDFLWDVSNYITWQYNMIEAERVSSSGNEEMIYRSEIDAPWPVDNRELFVQVKMKQEGATTQVFIHSIPTNRPTKDGVVRVPFFDASWKIIPDGNSLKVTYSLRIDPGGSVPAWLANIAMAEGPYISFKKLKEQFAK